MQPDVKTAGGNMGKTYKTHTYVNPFLKIYFFATSFQYTRKNFQNGEMELHEIKNIF